jgi:hypothetical protein
VFDLIQEKVIGQLRIFCRNRINLKYVGVNIMTERVATWGKTSTGYESVCTHCGTTNFSKDPIAQQMCIQCNKEYLTKVAHTEED